MSTDEATTPISDSRPAYTVAGFLAAMAIFVDLIGLAWHPLRLIGPGIVISMIAAGMAPKGNKLARAAVAVSAICFFLGMMIGVVAQRPLW
ncbi:MAG: hypothetical protein ABUS54_12295 [Actinomycetota bacterium]